MSNKILKRQAISMLTEGAILLALTITLNMIKLYKLPTGGSVTLFGYLPLFIFALRHGLVKGLLLGALYGLIDFLREPYFVNVVQVFLDYIFSYAALGLAGLFVRSKEKISYFNVPNVLAMLLAAFVRFIFALASGVFFFADGKEFVPALLFSAAYNAPYVFVNSVLAIVAVWFLDQPLKRLKK